MNPSLSVNLNLGLSASLPGLGLPTPGLPSGALPSGALPSGAVPSGAVPSGAVPSASRPSAGSLGNGPLSVSVPPASASSPGLNLPSVGAPSVTAPSAGGLSAPSAAASSLVPSRTLPAVPSVPSIIAAGTVYGQVYNYVFYANTVVSVNGGFLDPRTGAIQGLLPGGQLVACLADGLHIANRLVPYPPAWLGLINALGIQLPIISRLPNLIPA